MECFYFNCHIIRVKLSGKQGFLKCSAAMHFCLFMAVEHFQGPNCVTVFCLCLKLPF